MNIITIVGNVGRAPDSRTTASGQPVVNISVATSRKYKGEEQTEWHRVTAFGKTAEIVASYVRKGDRVGVTGRMTYGSYERDGVTIPTAEILANEVHLLGSRIQAGADHPQPGSLAEPAPDPFPF